MFRAEFAALVSSKKKVPSGEACFHSSHVALVSIPSPHFSRSFALSSASRLPTTGRGLRASTNAPPVCLSVSLSLSPPECARPDWWADAGIVSPSQSGLSRLRTTLGQRQQQQKVSRCRYTLHTPSKRIQCDQMKIFKIARWKTQNGRKIASQI